MNIAAVVVIGLGALLALANKASAKAGTAEAPPESTAPQLPPPEPQAAAPDTAPRYEEPQYATPATTAAAAAAATAPRPLSSNRPFGDQPLNVDVPDQGEAQAAAAEERAQASAPQPSAATAKAGTALSFKKSTPATPTRPKLAAVTTNAPKPATPATKRTAVQAATELLEYVTAAIRSGQTAALGSKGSPNPLVKAAQLDMGISPADGIYGPATRNRGKAITGKAFPARDAAPKSVAPTVATAKPKPKAAAAVPKLTAVATVAPKPPSARSPTQAARDLLAYASAAIARKAPLGSKGSPDSFVKAAQIDMGISPADGIYGPATRNKGKALTGSTFPAR